MQTPTQIPEKSAVRILHTSDWHLGQFFYGKSRYQEHKAFLDWLLTQIKDHHVDALVVAGDIFDTSSPPSYARSLYNQFIVAMTETQCQLFIVGGNHDSVAMLSESKELLACLNTKVIPDITDDVNDHIFVIKDKNHQAKAILGAVPFLRPRSLITSEAGLSGEHKQQQLGESIAQYYADIFDEASKLSQRFDKPLPVILTGHLTTVGASSSESVREIYIGSLDAFNAHQFPKADYIALGHIHRPQKVAKSEHIRYSGSPLCLSFDELSSNKQLLMVDFDDAKQLTVTEIDVPVFQQLTRLKGDLSDIELAIKSLLKDELASDAADTKTIWLSIEVNTQDYLSDLQGRIQQIIDDAKSDQVLEVLQLKRTRQQDKTIVRECQETLSELNFNQVFERRLAMETCDCDDKKAQFSRITAIFNDIANQVASNTEAQKTTDGEQEL